MAAWIPITIFAALTQSWRTAIQQRLRGILSVNAAGFVRFLYGAPTALVIFLAALAVTGQTVPTPNALFLRDCLGAACCQILATNLLIMAFGYRNFAVGTAYAKTEVAQSAILALIVLHEALTALSWIGIGLGLCGVMTLSLAGRGLKPRELLAATFQPAALCGLGSGFLFAITAVSVKLANHAIPGSTPVMKALFSVVIVNSMQTLLQGSWLAWRAPAELRKTFTSWRISMWAGALSGCGSACWYIGFAMTDVALVRAVGQVEIVFILLFSRFYLKEQLRRSDIAGLCLVVAGVLVIVLGY